MSSTSFRLPRVAAPVVFVLSLVLAACSSGGTPASAGASGGGSGGGTATVVDGKVTITADDMAFDASEIKATAGQAFTITFVNNDSAPHNISIYVSQGGDSIVQGAIINQGETVEVQVPALDAGEYYFVCDVHPDMNGKVVVSA